MGLAAAPAGVPVAAVALASPAPPAVANGKVQPGRAEHLANGLSVANTAAFADHGVLAFISQGQLLVLDGG